jgi:hypothetical protein
MDRALVAFFGLAPGSTRGRDRTVGRLDRAGLTVQLEEGAQA